MSSQVRAGGPVTGASRVTFGGGVVTDLAAGLVAHSKTVRRPVVVGCVYVLTSGVVVDALTEQEGVCIVLEKGLTKSEPGSEHSTIRELQRRARPLASSYLPGFHEVTSRVDGRPAIIGPHEYPPEEVDLGPVRVAGYRGGTEGAPLLHAKVAVCCDAWFAEDGEFGPARGLRAIRAWIGSANWTDRSMRHTEIGVWVDDPYFADLALDFVSSVVLRSEMLDSQRVTPKPDLAEAELDMDALSDCAAQYYQGTDFDDFDDLEETE